MTVSHVHDLLTRIQMEYVEMPGLRLTLWQACRLWTLAPDVAETLLYALVDAGFLIETRDGAFCRSGARPRDLAARVA